MHKLDNIEYNTKVSFCVVGKTKVLPDQFATDYESAVVFGVASEIKEDERYNALMYIDLSAREIQERLRLLTGHC